MPEQSKTQTTVPQSNFKTIEFRVGNDNYTIPIDVYRIIQTLSLQNEEYKSAILKTKEYRLYYVDDAGNYGAQLPHQRNDLNSFSNFSCNAVPYQVAILLYQMEMKLNKVALGFSNVSPAYSEKPSYEEVSAILSDLREDIDLLQLSHVKW